MLIVFTSTFVEVIQHLDASLAFSWGCRRYCTYHQRNAAVRTAVVACNVSERSVCIQETLAVTWSIQSIVCAQMQHDRVSVFRNHAGDSLIHLAELLTYVTVSVFLVCSLPDNPRTLDAPMTVTRFFLTGFWGAWRDVLWSNLIGCSEVTVGLRSGVTHCLVVVVWSEILESL